MGSGVGLEAAIHSISQGGYGIISKDFSQIMKGINKGTPLERELRSVLKKAETDGYKRLINTMINNVTQNTDIIETLRKQGERMEESRTESVKEYIEELGGVPETLLSIGMIGADYFSNSWYRTPTYGRCRRTVWHYGSRHDNEYSKRRIILDISRYGINWIESPY